ncbi:MAG: hypothetical protein R2753_03365 [Chitinophagales bacterium]
MKHLLIIIAVSLFFIQPNLVNAQGPTIERANSPDGKSLEHCESSRIGNLGFYNPYNETHYVVLIQGSALISHFKIEFEETKWQTGVRANSNVPYFYYVFTIDPGKEVQKIKSNLNYLYKSAVYPVKCENELITIAY